MERVRRSAGAVVRLALYFMVLAGTSCTVGNIYYGDYQGDGQQKIIIAADSTFRYSAPGLMDTPNVLTGTWTRADKKLLLHAKGTDTRKLQPAVTLEKTEEATSKLVIAPEIGVNVHVDVLVDGVKVGEIGRNDSSFVFEGPLNQLVLKAYAAGMYADLFRNDTLYSDSIALAHTTGPVLATVTLQVALRNFYKVPVEDSYLQIRSREKLYWEKKNTLFFFDE